MLHIKFNYPTHKITVCCWWLVTLQCCYFLANFDGFSWKSFVVFFFFVIHKMQNVVLLKLVKWESFMERDLSMWCAFNVLAQYGNHKMEKLRLFDVYTVYPMNLSMSTPAIRTSMSVDNLWLVIVIIFLIWTSI